MDSRRLLPIVGVVAIAGLAVLGVPWWEGSGPSAIARSIASSFNPNHDCTYCHDIHGNVNPTLLNDEKIEDLCLTCHGPGGVSSLKADTHNVGGGIDLTCIDCHHHHKNMTNWLGGTNLKMVGRDFGGIARLATPNSGVRDVVFESRGTTVGEPSLHSFADADEDNNGVYDGVCETCHTDTDFHHNNPSGNHSHHTGKTCTVCHTHEDGFEEP